MVTLGFRFPAGRYHATPWGHQVNEGLVEWPPSPWRLLRALLSSGYTRLGWQEAPPAVAKELLESLCGKLPVYHVPAASVAHTRHYMPTAQFQTGKQLEATTLVLDTWGNVAGGELQVTWDVTLPAEHRQLLGTLVERMNYLGRSESWVIGRVVPDGEARVAPNVVPHEFGTPLDRGEELVSLMAPVAFDRYAAWRAERVPPAEPSGKRKPSAKQLGDQKKREEPYPSSLLDALEWDTKRWQGYGWSQPPGSELVQYRRPRGVLSAMAQPMARVVSHCEPADLILLSVASSSGGSGLLPASHRTLPQAELIHDALVRRACADGQVPPEEISGRALDGSPLSGHRHAHVLPLDLDEDGHLDHVLLWAKTGFSLPAQEAAAGLRRTFAKGGKEALRVAMAGRALQASTTSWPSGLERFVGSSRRWLSETPFVAPRFLKKSGTNSIEGQIRAELASRGLPAPTNVTVALVPEPGVLPDRLNSQFRHFVRRRARGGKVPPQDIGWYVELEFGEEVRGPICIGYASHFGLGLMRWRDGEVGRERSPHHSLPPNQPQL